MTVSITSSGISLDGPLVAGEKVAVSVSGLALAAEDKPTLALLARFPDALLASVELAESETAGTWTGELDTATKQTALFFATARADERRDAALELVAGRVSLARLTVPMANSALCPKPDGSPFASPVYVPVPGPPGQGGDPYDQAPQMDGEASAGVSDEYARGDHRHPTDTSRMAATAMGVDIKAGGDVGNISITAALTQLDEDLGGKQDTIADLAAIRSGAEAGATAVQPSALAAYRTASAQDEIDDAQDAAIAAKYTKPATGIPASDIATGVIPSVPSLPISISNGGTGATSKNAALANLGAVKKSGDTMTGDLEVQRTSGSYTGGTVSVRSVPDGSGEALVKVAATDGAELYLDAASGYNPSIAVKRAGGELKEIEVPNNNGTLALQDGIAPAFSTSSTYAVGDYCTHEGLLYKCTTAVSTAGSWNAENWSAVAVMSEATGGSPKNVWYGTCTTLGTSSIKVATTTSGNFVAAKGNVVIVKFSYASSTGMTLNVDGTGAYNIKAAGSNIGEGYWTSNEVRTFVFDGSDYVLADYAKASTSTLGVVQLSSTVSSNTSYAATPSAVNTRAPKASPEFTGTPKAPTAAAGTNTTQIATTAFVQTAARYALTAKTPSVSGTSATVACEDRAINDFTVATGITSLTITPPAAVTGRARDFFCRVTLADSSLPTVTLSGGTIDIGASEVAGMTQGVNLLMFTEISSGHWLASRRSAS